MKLKIVNPESTNISKKFDINPARLEHLCDLVESLYIKTATNKLTTPLVELYQVMANACDNIEEYTMCMHMLIFNLSKIGKPQDDAAFVN